MLLIKKLLIS